MTEEQGDPVQYIQEPGTHYIKYMNPASETESDRGQVGIGTLIVFIAMIMVAAIAAGVLMNTAGYLQTQAEDTGTASTEQVADAIQIINTVGTADGEQNITEIRVSVQKGPGSGDINLETLSIQYTGGGDFANLIYEDDYAGDDLDSNNLYNYSLDPIVTTEGVNNVLVDSGDRYEIVINLTDEPDEERPLGKLEPNDEVELLISTEQGSSREAILRVPDSLQNVNKGENIPL